MMPPRLVLNERLRRGLPARRPHVLPVARSWQEGAEYLARELDALVDGLQVLLVRAAGGVARVERVEGDEWRVERVRAAQRDGARAVARVAVNGRDQLVSDSPFACG